MRGVDLRNWARWRARFHRKEIKEPQAICAVLTTQGSPKFPTGEKACLMIQLLHAEPCRGYEAGAIAVSTMDEPREIAEVSLQREDFFAAGRLNDRNAPDAEEPAISGGMVL